MDWCTWFAGSRGERVSWVAGQAHSCTSLVLIAVKPLHFMVTRWAEKIRNSAEHLSFSFSKKAKYCNLWRWLKNDPESAANEVLFVLFCFSSILLQCTSCENEVLFCFDFPLVFPPILLQCMSCALNYYSIHHCCQNQRICVHETTERCWEVTALLECINTQKSIVPQTKQSATDTHWNTTSLHSVACTHAQHVCV